MKGIINKARPATVGNTPSIRIQNIHGMMSGLNLSIPTTRYSSPIVPNPTTEEERNAIPKTHRPALKMAFPLLHIIRTVTCTAKEEPMQTISTNNRLSLSPTVCANKLSERTPHATQAFHTQSFLLKCLLTLFVFRMNANIIAVTKNTNIVRRNCAPALSLYFLSRSVCR